ncbi:Abi family protein [uncultured Microbacterium sp.]|uniref:Abi family protein n=1 Tax=uncultured Microbacterium sp. TaxID=191216 RepID=UPI0025E8F2BA|nr:Abi family protein [uncultured Microbacterium sp.]
MSAKPALSWSRQRELLLDRGLTIARDDDCEKFLASENYYRFAGYARYFQRAPHHGDDAFLPGTTFEQIRAVYDADRLLRELLSAQLARVEILLRSHTAYVIALSHGPRGRYLQESFYAAAGDHERTVESAFRDIKRSKERHILRFAAAGDQELFGQLPVWSAVEAWSFGTLSKCIERGDAGRLAAQVAASLGVAKSGFAYRVRALVYLRNRCAHHGRLWHHSVIDAGPTPNNVRAKAKRLAGQFAPRSVFDVVASLDDIVLRGTEAAPLLPALVDEFAADVEFWGGLALPISPRDHVTD